MQATRANSGLRRFYQLFLGLLRQYRSSILLYSGVLFGIYTVPTLISYFDDYNFFGYWAEGGGHNFNGLSMVMFVIYIMIVPLSLGVKHFGYMHSKRAVDLYHALPVKRSELYLAQTAVGMIVLSVPVLINFGIVFCLQIIAGQSAYTAVGLVNMVLWLVAGYAIFAITGFCAVNVGSGLDTALFSMALNGAPAAIYLLNMAVRDLLLYGFWFDDRNMEWATRLSPIPTMVLREMMQNNTYYYSEPDLIHTGTTMIVWLFIAIAITVVSVLLYKRRKSETAEVVGNFGPAQIGVRAMVYYLGSVLFAIAFEGIFYYDENHTYFVIGAAVGALVTGIIGEMVLTRSPKMAFKRIPIILGVTAVAALGSVLYANGGFGYETYVPNTDNVESVYVNFTDGYTYFNGYRSDGNRNFEDPETIKLIAEAHRAQVDNHKLDPSESLASYGSSFSVTYAMKDGSQTSRRYYGLYDSTINKLIELSFSPTYVEQRSEFFRIEPSEIGTIALSSILQDTTEEVMLSSAQKGKLLEAIRADLLKRDMNSLVSGAKAVGLMEVNISYIDEYYSEYGYSSDYIRDNYDVEEAILEPYYPPNTYTATLYFTVYEGDTETLAFLADNELTDAIAADPSRITDLWVIESGYAYYYYDGLLSGLNTNIGSEINYMVENYLENEGQNYYNYRYDYMIAVDPARADELLSLGKATSLSNSDTLIIAFRTDESVGRTGYLYIDRDDLPADLVQELKKAAEYNEYADYYDPYGEYGYSDDDATPELEAGPETDSPDQESAPLNVVPVGTLSILY